MKIAIPVSDLIDTNGGGYTFESQLLEEILRLSAYSSHEFVLFTSNPQKSNYFLNTSVQVISTDRSFITKVYSYLAIKFKKLTCKLLKLTFPFPYQTNYKIHINRLLQDHKIDIVLSLAPICFNEVDCPYITPIWDLAHRTHPYFPEVSSHGQWEEREMYYTKVIRRAAFIVTGTEIGKAEVEKLYQVSSDRIKVIPFFTPKLQSNPILTNQDVIKKYHIPKQYLFYPAQFWAHKNHSSILLALQILKNDYGLNMPLVLAGSDKGNLSYVKSMVKNLELTDNVYFLGFVPQEDLFPLYNQAFALIYMTFFGPDNLPPLEAMSASCPVIASNVSGASEQLGNAALIVDHSNPQEIAKAIKLLYDDSILRNSLIERGLVRANQWKVEDYARELLKLVDEFQSIRSCWK
jgi:glycosyltransferase involved in cell wall biosynthesis